jgi:hypothetical protein
MFAERIVPANGLSSSAEGLCNVNASRISDMFACAMAIADSLAAESNPDFGTYLGFRENWISLKDTLNDLGGEIKELPSSVREHIQAIAIIVNEAGVGPGFHDLCMVLRDSRLREHAKSGWKALSLETRGLTIPWAATNGETGVAAEEQDSEPVLWRMYPFFTPPHAGPVGSFSAAALQAIGTPIPLPTIKPDPAELATLLRHYPDANPAQPPWLDIKADLLAAGIPWDSVSKASSRVLVRMLDSVRSRQKKAEDGSIVDADPETIAELQHIRSLGINQQMAAMMAFRINQASRRHERERLAPNRPAIVEDATPPTPITPDRTSKIGQQPLDNMDMPAGVIPTPASEYSKPSDLTSRERTILEAIGSKTLQAKPLAKAAGYSNNSHFRDTLSNLVKRSHLKKCPEGSGYFRA